MRYRRERVIAVKLTRAEPRAPALDAALVEAIHDQRRLLSSLHAAFPLPFPALPFPALPLQLLLLLLPGRWRVPSSRCSRTAAPRGGAPVPPLRRMEPRATDELADPTRSQHVETVSPQARPPEQVSLSR